ncbi:MAG: polysaccharide export protein EpsE [Burkholderiales bacterium]
MRTLLSCLSILALLLAGATNAADYRLGSGDVVKITVFDHPELKLDTRVDEQGQINFPLVGAVPVAGETAATAQKRIALALEKGGFLKNAQVNLIVDKYRSQQVSVLGKVKKPGKYSLEGPSTVTDLVAEAGGIMATGSDTIMLIHRQQNGQPQQVKIDTRALYQHDQLTQDQQVRDGDVIFVPKAPVFYIYGEVQKPGAFRLERHMTVMQALSVGGGITPRGTERGIQIRRRGEDGKTTSVTASLGDEIRPDDVIYVKESLF